LRLCLRSQTRKRSRRWRGGLCSNVSRALRDCMSRV
jgi:hypothetical protein